MKVRDLINTCQNQWLGLHNFNVNKFFKIHFIFQDFENTESYTIDEFNNYHLDGISNNYIFNLINKRHDQDVLAWSIIGVNDIQILVKEF